MQELLFTFLLSIIAGFCGGLTTYLVNIGSSNYELVSLRKEERYRKLLKEITNSEGSWEKVRQQVIEMHLFCPKEIVEKVWNYLDFYAANEEKIRNPADNPMINKQLHNVMSDLIIAMRSDIKQSSSEQTFDWIRLPL